MPEVQTEQYTGLFALVPGRQTENSQRVAITDILGIVSIGAAGIWTSQQCETKLEELLGRSLTVAEGLDLTTFIQYVVNGGSMAECNLQKLRNGFEMVERQFNLTDAEIRQLAGV
jgi:hypothetical protein